MSISTKTKVVIPTGLALFAMFFGAGSMVLPLQLGSISGQHTWLGLIVFLILGVGVPFLGLFAGALYEGDYWKFFERIGKVPAFLFITFLILMIGPVIAIPRTETVVYGTLHPMLPEFLQSIYVFDFIYFFFVYLVISNQSRVVDIIGWILSPVKITTFILLIVVGLYMAQPLVAVTTPVSDVALTAVTMGYGTMDLLASLFFCSVAYRNIQNKCDQMGFTTRQEIIRMTLYSCVIGALLISLVYMGFIFVAAFHAQELQGAGTSELLGKIAGAVLGDYGSIFVGICVTFACLTTASALAEVTTEFFYEIVFKFKVPRQVCVFVLLAMMYIISVFGFDKIMMVAAPILHIVYPALIILCVVNIYLKLKELKNSSASI
ncbi:MAG: branched-chain amino acid transport system II carrier protein [Gammaproteobacteria bacterium]|nr:branched-chain amino acid transport system II carrier protein [Gammaproteobacteria bacterium]